MNIFVHYHSTFCFRFSNPINASILREEIENKTGIPKSLQLLYYGVHNIGDEEIINNDQWIELTLGLQGGKGGFGCLLRGFKRKRKMDQDACRDLSGRRIKYATQAKELAEWKEKEAEGKVPRSLTEKKTKRRMCKYGDDCKFIGTCKYEHPKTQAEDEIKKKQKFELTHLKSTFGSESDYTYLDEIRSSLSSAVAMGLKRKKKAKEIVKWTCNACSKLSDFGYHCSECDDFDLCEECFDSKVEIGTHLSSHSMEGIRSTAENEVDN